MADHIRISASNGSANRGCWSGDQSADRVCWSGDQSADRVCWSGDQSADSGVVQKSGCVTDNILAD